MGLLKNKIAIITGGGRWIGKAIAHQYCKEGATVIIAEFNEQNGKKIADLISGHFFKADISDEESVASLFKYVNDPDKYDDFKAVYLQFPLTSI